MALSNGGRIDLTDRIDEDIVDALNEADRIEAAAMAMLNEARKLRDAAAAAHTNRQSPLR